MVITMPTPHIQACTAIRSPSTVYCDTTLERTNSKISWQMTSNMSQFRNEKDKDMGQALGVASLPEISFWIR